MIYEIWLDAFSFWAFIFFLGVATGVWLGVAHGGQIEAIFAKFRPEPKMTPETARAVLFAIQDQLADRVTAKTCRIPILSRHGLDSVILPPLKDGRTEISRNERT